MSITKETLEQHLKDRRTGIQHQQVLQQQSPAHGVGEAVPERKTAENQGDPQQDQTVTEKKKGFAKTAHGCICLSGSGRAWDPGGILA